MAKQIKVIYILGGGHSGSTLLDKILSTNPAIVSGGEISFYCIYRDKVEHPKINRLTRHRCSCQKDLEKCPYWGKIVTADNGRLKIKKNYTLGENFNVIVELYRRKKIKKHEVTNSNYDLFKLMLDVKPAQYILDSSKDPRRLLDLYHDPRIKLFVIHLIRDGRSYAYSYQKPVRKKIGVKQYCYLRSLVEWIIINTIAIRQIKKLDAPAVTINYETFCRQPNQEIKKIEKLTNLKFDVNKHNPEHHSISGNYKTLEMNKPIKLVEKWKNKTPWPKKLMGTIILFPFRGWLDK